MDKVPQDENKTKKNHMVIIYSHVILITSLLLEICNRALRCLVKIQCLNVLGVSSPEEKGLE